MGYQLVGAAFRPEWSSQLTSTEHLALVAMCHLALDKPRDDKPAGRFYGGHEFIMLRLDGTDHGDDPRARRTAEQRVRRALRRLEDVGAIETVREGKNGGKAEYQILVWQPPLPVDNPNAVRRRPQPHPYTHVGVTPTPM